MAHISIVVDNKCPSLWTINVHCRGQILPSCPLEGVFCGYNHVHTLRYIPTTNSMKKISEKMTFNLSKKILSILALFVESLIYSSKERTIFSFNPWHISLQLNTIFFRVVTKPPLSYNFDFIPLLNRTPYLRVFHQNSDSWPLLSQDVA